MFVVFKSKVAGDVPMLGDHAKELLTVLGKEWAERGVITIDQLPGAIKRMETAIQAEPAEADDADDADERESGQQAVGLKRRSFPLLDLLRRSQAAGADVLWETQARAGLA